MKTLTDLSDKEFDELSGATRGRIHFCGQGFQTIIDKIRGAIEPCDDLDDIMGLLRIADHLTFELIVKQKL